MQLGAPTNQEEMQRTKASLGLLLHPLNELLDGIIKL